MAELPEKARKRVVRAYKAFYKRVMTDAKGRKLTPEEKKAVGLSVFEELLEQAFSNQNIPVSERPQLKAELEDLIRRECADIFWDTPLASKRSGSQDKKPGRKPGLMGKKKVIRQALRALLSCPEKDAFVILEDRSSGKFVQFAGSVSDPLLLDLPRQTLDEAELKRAERLFGKLGAHLNESEVLDAPGGSIAGTQSGFQLELGRDVDRATQIALTVFSEIYALPPVFDLGVEES